MILFWRALPKHWHSPLLVAIVRVVRVELDLAVIGVPVQVRHVRPSLVAGDALCVFILLNHWA